MNVPTFGMLALAVACALSVSIAWKIAVKRALFDQPNERSSHRVPVPRLGGAAFVPLVLSYLAVEWSGNVVHRWVQVAFIAAACVLYILGLLDDFVSLRAVPRLVIQMMCVSTTIAVIGATRQWAVSTGVALIIGAVITVGVVGVLNIYNFMDGIDGIAGVQAVTGGAAWVCIAGSLGLGASGVLAGAVAAGAVGFLLLNWPPARIFMGDAGSTVLGYAFGILPLLAWAEQKSTLSLGTSISCEALVMWPFLADGTLTILRRLIKRENVLTAHRSHLYQRLVIAGRSHQEITLTYGGLAAIGGLLGWCVANGLPFATQGALAAVPLLFAGLWLFTRTCEKRVTVPRGENGHQGQVT